jgi:hypothetical protein
VRLTAETGERLHHYDEPSRTLFLSTRLRPGQRAFRMATQLALLEYGDELDRQAGEDFPPGSSARDLARIGIANYFAAALILPYTAFHSAAEEVRYDIERLTDRYGLGYETVCHRLSTLQRPRLRGVPFSFVRVDRAGNLSKRQSATGFHFSRAGGTCPLWNVYEAFAAPAASMSRSPRCRRAALPLDGSRDHPVPRRLGRTRQDLRHRSRLRDPSRPPLRLLRRPRPVQPLRRHPHRHGLPRLRTPRLPPARRTATRPVPADRREHQHVRPVSSDRSHELTVRRA